MSLGEGSAAWQWARLQDEAPALIGVINEGGVGSREASQAAEALTILK